MMKVLRRFAKSISIVLVAAVFSLAQTPLIEKCACPPPPPAPTATTQPSASVPLGPFGHPHPQMRPQRSTVTTIGNTTYVSTGQSLFPQSDPFKYPPGTNFLPTIYTNMFDGFGKEMPNTLPSTPDVPYNLHDGEPVVSKIDPASPTDDLLEVLELARSLPHDAVKPAGLVKPPLSKENKSASDEEIKAKIQRGLDILEGNPIPDRVYGGLPLLHYKGPEKSKKVVPIFHANRQVFCGQGQNH